jgi:hypothetical protein
MTQPELHVATVRPSAPLADAIPIAKATPRETYENFL